MKASVIILGVIFSAALISCQKSVLDPAAYAKWVCSETNGLRVEKELGNYIFCIQYKPHKYEALLENGKNRIVGDSIRSMENRLSGMQYYTFRITSKTEKDMLRTDLQDDNDYYGRLEYFVSPAQENISLIDGNDTLPCLLYHFERNYGLAPFNNIVLAFEESKKKEKSISDKTLVFDDQVLGIGPVRLTIKGKNIEQIPDLRLEQKNLTR